jgi:hypothetical protein
MQQQLSVREAARILGVSTSWLNKARVYGGGPRYAKIGFRVVYDPTDLATYVSERRVQHTGELIQASL